MAEETKKTTPEAQCAAEGVVVTNVPVAEEKENEKDEASKETKISEPAALEEESSKADDLIDPEKKALDDFKLLIKEALIKHEFTATPPPPPPPAVIAKEDYPNPVEKKEEPISENKDGEPKTVEKIEPPEKEAAAGVEKKAENPAEKAEATKNIKENILNEVAATPLPPGEEASNTPAEEEKEAPLPEEISIWGVRLLADEKSDSILLKFLRARDFKVKEAFAMLKTVVAWRKEFEIEELIEEEKSIIEGLEKVVYMHGVDKEGHPVCYNAVGEFQNKELYDKTFAEAEKRAKFLKWYIQFLEKNIRKLDFSPDGISTIVQIIDLKNSPGLNLFKKELRLATNQALQLLQDNYPEFVAKQVFINVPWWYLAYNRLISPFLTQRTKSKFVFAGSIKSTETLFKYIAPEQVPSQYGGLSKYEDQEFTTADPATEETIKPTSKHTVELPITEAGTLVWEARVVGWDVSYGAEFVPSAEDGYTLIVQKSRKIWLPDEQIVSCSFKTGEAGKVVLTFDNQTSKKKKLIYRSKTKSSSSD